MFSTSPLPLNFLTHRYDKTRTVILLALLHLLFVEMALQCQGNIMCVLRPTAMVPKGEQQQEYGILVHNMQENSTSGTCLMTNGRYVTLAAYDIAKAFRRIKEETYKITPVREKKLQELYITASSNLTALNINIKKSLMEYNAELKRVQEAREARRLDQARIPKAKKEKKAPRKCTLKDITLGAAVCIFFRKDELPSHRQQKKPATSSKAEASEDDGEWLIGIVTEMVRNPSRKLVFTCVFDTPTMHKRDFDTNEIKKGRDDYVRLHCTSSSEDETSPDGLSTSSDEAAHESQQNKQGGAGRGPGTTARVVIPETQDERSSCVHSDAPDQQQEGSSAAVASQTNDAVHEQLHCKPVGEVSEPEEVVDEETKHDAPSIEGNPGTQYQQQNKQPAGKESELQASAATLQHCNAAGEVSAPAEVFDEETKDDAPGIGDNPGTQDQQQHKQPAGKESELEALVGAHQHSRKPAGEVSDHVEAVDEETKQGHEIQKPAVEVSDHVETKQGHDMHKPAGHVSDHAEAVDEETKERHVIHKPAVEVGDHAETVDEATKKGHEIHKPMDKTVVHVGKRPSAIYKKFQRLLKKRCFPCPTCGDAADGSHQCGVCFAHVHVICGNPFKDACEGYGQLLYCRACDPGKRITSPQFPPPPATPPHDTWLTGGEEANDETDDQTQVWEEDEEPIGSQAPQPDAFVGAARDTTVYVPASSDAAEGNRLEIAQFLKALPRMGTQDNLKEAVQTSQLFHEPTKKRKCGNADMQRSGQPDMSLQEQGGRADVNGKGTQVKKKKRKVGPTTEKSNGLQGIKKKLNVGTAYTNGKGTQGKKKKRKVDLPSEDGKESAVNKKIQDVEANNVWNDNETGTENNEDEDYNMNEWYWDDTIGTWARWSEKFQTWVYNETKRVRKKDLTNKMEKNWSMSMRRNFDTAKKDKMIAKITIKRDAIHTVRLLPPLLLRTQISLCHYSYH